jgi:TP901 family phage tail tape measure protein
MAKQLHMSMTVDADTSGAQAQLKKLNESLNQIRSKPAALFDNTNLQKASQAAATLQRNLAAATDVKTGKLDLSKFSQSLDKSNIKLQDVRATLSALGPQGEKAFLQLSKSIAQADAPMLRMNAKLRDFATTLKNTARWQISSSILHGFMGTLQSAYGYAKDLDRSLNDIRIVTGQSADEMARFAQQANKSAQALSTTTTKYTDAALIFYQQGLKGDAVKERTDTVIKMANVTGEAAKDVSSYMTAIWNNFDDGSKSLEHYADVLTALGAATASSTDEISSGLEKFAAIAETTGLSYDYATSALATLISNTRQSADVVGTSLKTIFSRIEGVSLGETLEDGVDLNKYSTALQKIGVSVLDASGEMRKMDDILEDMASKWDNLTNAQKMATAQTVAGVRQYNNLISLMDNWGDMQTNLETAKGADGSLDIQAEIYAESWEAARERVRAASENIYDSLINEDFFKAFDNGFAKVLNLVAGFIDGLGGMKGVLGTIGGFITQKLAKEAPTALARIKDTMAYIKGDALKKAEELQQQNLEQLNKTDVSGDDAAYNAEVEGVTRIQVMKQNLLKVQNQLSEAERQAYEYEIQQAEAINDIIVKEGERLNAIKARNKENEGKLVNKVAEKQGGKGKKFDAKAFRDAEGKAKGFTDQLEKASIAIGKINALSKKVKVQGDQRKKAAVNVKGNVQATEDLKKAYKKTFDELESRVDTSAESWKNLKTAMDGGDVDAIADAFTALGEDVSVFTEAGANIDAFQQDVDNAATSLTRMGADSSEVYNLSEGFIQAGESASQLSDQMQNANENAAEVPTHVTSMSEAFTSAVGAAMSLSAAVNSITSFSEIMSDEDATVGQQISAIFAVLTSTIMAFNAVKTAAIAIKAIDTAATTANATSHFVLAAAEVAATVAAWPLALVMLALVATIGGLVAIVLALSFAFKEIAANSPEGKLKKAKEAAKDLAEAANEAKNRAQELHDAFDKYDEIQDKIKNCTKGTQEWKDSMEELNDQVLDMIATYPELMQYTERDSVTGGLKFKEGTQEQALQAADQRADAARYASLMANATVQQAQVDVDLSDLEWEAVMGDWSYDAMDSSRLMENIDQLAGLTEEEYRAKLKELGICENSIDCYMGLQSELDKLAVSSQEASHNLELIGDIVASNELGDEYDAAEKKLAGEKYEDTYNDIYDEVIDLSHENKQADKHGDTAEDLMDRYWDAAGISGAGYASNMVRGTDSSRVYAYIDANGDEKEVSEEQLASTIAAYEALEKLAADAELAARALGEVDANVGEDIGAGIRGWIASDNFEGMSESDFATMQADVKAAGGTDAYLMKAFGVSSTEELATVLGDDYKKRFENAMGDYSTALDSFMDNMLSATQTSFEKIENTDELSVAAQKSIAGVLNNALANDNSTEPIEKVLNSLEVDELEKFANIADSIDWDNTTLEEFKTTLGNVGINVDDLTDQELQAMINSLDATGLSVEELTDKYDEQCSIINKLNDGDTISAEDYEALAASYKEYFHLQLDGTYKLVGAAKELQAQLKSDQIADYTSQIQRLAEDNDRLNAIKAQNYDFADLSKTQNYTDSAGKNWYTEADVYKQLDLLEQMNVGNEELAAKIETWRADLADDSTTTDVLQNIADEVENCRASFEGLDEQIANNNARALQLDIAIAESAEDMDELRMMLDQGKISTEAFNTAAREMDDALDVQNLDPEELEQYADYLKDAAKNMDNFNDNMDDNEAEIVAKGIMKMNRAIETLAENFVDAGDDGDSWIDILKKSEKTSEEYADAMMGTKNAVAELLDVSADYVSNDFIIEHLDEINQAATGDADAIDDLKAALLDPIVAKIEVANELEEGSLATMVADLQTQLDEIGPLEVGASVDDTSFIDACNEMIAASGMTSDQVNAMFDAMGFEANFATEGQEVKTMIPEYTTYHTPSVRSTQTINGQEVSVWEETSWTEQTGQHEAVGEAASFAFTTDGSVPKVTSITKKASGSSNNYSSSNKGGKTSPGKTSGGKEKDTQKRKGKNDDVDRYHEINNAIDDLEEAMTDLTREYDKLSTQSDRAFGAAKIKLIQKQRQEIDKQVNAIDKQIAAQKKLLAEEKKYLEQDRRKAEEAGWVFGKDGNVANYEATLQRIKDQYNAVIDAYNAMDAKAQEAYKKQKDANGNDPLQAAEEQYQNALDALQQYEDTLERIEDTENTIADKEKERLEKLQEQYDLLLAEVQTEIELKITVDDTALDLLKDKLADLGDSADNALDVIANINQQVDRVQTKTETYREGIHKTINTLKDYGVSDADLQKVNSAIADGSLGKMDTKQLQEMFSSSEIVDYGSLIADLQEYSNELLAMNEEIRAYKDQVFDTMSAAFNEYLEDLERYEAKTEHAKKLTQGYKDLITSLGKANIDKDGSLTKQINEALVSESKDALREAQATQDYAQSAFDKAKAEYEKYSTQGSPWYNEEMARKWKAQMEECEDALMAAEEKTQEALQATAEAIKTAFKDTIAQIMDDLDDSLGSVSHLQQQFDQAQELSEQYLDDYKKIYELSKLTRQVNKTMDETNNVKAKKMLMEYQAKINKYQQDGVKMSQYELEHLQKEYELRLAQIQLEEAQNAKSQVRMTRDSEGNYGYVYTADDSAQSDAQQNYEDKLYALQELNTQYITEMQRLSLEIQAQWQETLNQILEDDSLSLAEQQARIAEASDFYTQRLAYVNEQLGIAVGNNRTLYEEDWTKYSEVTGYKISADEDYVDTWGETTLAVLTGAHDQQGYYQSVQLAFSTAVASIQQETAKYQEALNAVGLSADALAGKISADVEVQKQASNEAALAAEDMSQRAQGAMEEIMNKAGEFSERWVTELEATITKNQEYVQSILDMITALSDLEAAANTPKPSNPPVDPGDGGGGGGGNGGGGGGGGGTPNNADKIEGVAAAIWMDGGGTSGWYNGNDRVSRLQEKGVTAAQAYINQHGPNGDIYAAWHNKRAQLKSFYYGSFDTGGYTGDWGDSEGRLALLHSKELVLNAQDTENMLAIIDMVRQISSAIDTNALSTLMSSGLTAASVNAKGNDVLEQHVTITAEFPNATDKDSILDAFDNVINLAAQYANRR